MKSIYTNEYYQKVKALLPEINFKEGRFLRDIKKVLTDYEKTYPKCTYEDLVEEFESPEEIVYNYITVEGEIYLFKALSRKKYSKAIAIVATITIIILGMATIGIILSNRIHVEKDFPTIKELEISVEGSNEN